MARPNPRDPSKGTGGGGYKPPIIFTPSPTPPVKPSPIGNNGDWFPKIPTWLNPFPPAQAEPTPPRIGTVAPAPQVCIEEDPNCGFREFFEGKPAGTYCKCENWFGWDGNGNGNGKERGCTECKSCSNEKIAMGTCDCGVHCYDPTTPPDPNDPDIQIPNAPTSGIQCQSGFTPYLDQRTNVWRCISDDEPKKPCTKCDSDQCQECDMHDQVCVDLRKANGTCTPPEECDLGCLLTARGCDCGCKDVKPCTTCDSAVCQECNAWDLQCEDCKKKDGTCTPPVSPCGCLPYDIGCEIGCWWDKIKNYVYIIGGLIGLVFLLWLLRPLFGVAKNVTGVSKSAVTRVNGMK